MLRKSFRPEYPTADEGGKIHAMKPDNALEKRLSALKGRRLSKGETQELTSSLKKAVPPWLTTFLSAYPIIGVSFTLSEKEDRSGLGVEMEWLTSDDMISEAKHAYPGIPALVMGYLPIGSCLSGTGDYYYISARAGEDPPVLRIPHDSVVDDEHIDESQIEIVAPSLGDFLKRARIS